MQIFEGGDKPLNFRDLMKKKFTDNFIRGGDMDMPILDTVEARLTVFFKKCAQDKKLMKDKDLMFLMRKYEYLSEQHEKPEITSPDELYSALKDFDPSKNPTKFVVENIRSALTYFPSPKGFLNKREALPLQNNELKKLFGGIEALEFPAFDTKGDNFFGNVRIFLLPDPKKPYDKEQDNRHLVCDFSINPDDTFESYRDRINKMMTYIVESQNDNVKIDFIHMVGMLKGKVSEQQQQFKDFQRACEAIIKENHQKAEEERSHQKAEEERKEDADHRRESSNKRELIVVRHGPPPARQAAVAGVGAEVKGRAEAHEVEQTDAYGVEYGGNESPRVKAREGYAAAGGAAAALLGPFGYGKGEVNIIAGVGTWVGSWLSAGIRLVTDWGSEVVGAARSGYEAGRGGVTGALLGFVSAVGALVTSGPVKGVIGFFRNFTRYDEAFAFQESMKRNLEQSGKGIPFGLPNWGAFVIGAPVILAVGAGVVLPLKALSRVAAVVGSGLICFFGGIAKGIVDGVKDGWAKANKVYNDHKAEGRKAEGFFAGVAAFFTGKGLLSKKGLSQFGNTMKQGFQHSIKYGLEGNTNLIPFRQGKYEYKQNLKGFFGGLLGEPKTIAQQRVTALEREQMKIEGQISIGKGDQDALGDKLTGLQESLRRARAAAERSRASMQDRASSRESVRFGAKNSTNIDAAPTPLPPNVSIEEPTAALGSQNKIQIPRGTIVDINKLLVAKGIKEGQVGLNESGGFIIEGTDPVQVLETLRGLNLSQDLKRSSENEKIVLIALQGPFTLNLPNKENKEVAEILAANAELVRSALKQGEGVINMIRVGNENIPVTDDELNQYRQRFSPRDVY